MKFLLLAFSWMVLFSPLHAQLGVDPNFALRIRLTDSVACTEVKDQNMSPTCWVFGTNSLFESDYIRDHKISPNLSEMFIARYAYIDKARQYLATKGKTYFEGGGQFHDVIRVVNNYGMVPEEVYNGKPNGELSHNHARLDSAMKKLANHFLKENKTSLDSADLQQMNDTLDRYLGKVPQRFWYKQKSYTARSFAQENVPFANDYIELVSFADHPYYKKFLLVDKFNWAADSFYNLPLEEFHMLVDTAIAKGWSVGWEGDVTEKGFNYYAGTASLPDAKHDYDKERVENYLNESTERDHMLQVAGIGKDQDNKKWYYMKNSWGSWFSKYGGYLYMDENYFRLKTVIMMVNKQALPESLKEKMQVK